MLRTCRIRHLLMGRVKQTARMSTGGLPVKRQAAYNLDTNGRVSGTIIGTHSGSFHCDEVLGCCMLQLLPEYKDAKIVRTRVPENLEQCDIVLDVGGVYDPEKKRFDHHQKGFMEVFPGFNTKLSSAGLIYKHYGKRVIAELLELPEDDDDVETVYLVTYKNFMEAIDAIDNGINQWEGSQVPKYISDTNLSSRVGRCNPDWNDDDTSDSEMDRRFKQAMELVKEEFQDRVTWLNEVWLPAREIVESAVKKGTEIDSSSEIIHLETGCPWKEHLYDLEKELSVKSPIKYVLYGDKQGGYRVQAVGLPGSFESRKALPAEWRGLRDEKLSEVSDIPGCVFVHASGFIGGNKSFDGAAAMARKALTL